MFLLGAWYGRTPTLRGHILGSFNFSRLDALIVTFIVFDLTAPFSRSLGLIKHSIPTTSRPLAFRKPPKLSGSASFATPKATRSTSVERFAELELSFPLKTNGMSVNHKNEQRNI